MRERDRRALLAGAGEKQRELPGDGGRIGIVVEEEVAVRRRDPLARDFEADAFGGRPRIEKIAAGAPQLTQDGRHRSAISAQLRPHVVVDSERSGHGGERRRRRRGESSRFDICVVRAPGAGIGPAFRVHRQMQQHLGAVAA